MAGVIASTADFCPDFGIPWDREFDARLESLADDEVQALLAFKVWFEGTAGITREMLDAELAKLSPNCRPLSMRFIADKNAQTDPIDWGWTLESWREVCEEFPNYTTHCIFGGNRAGKSSFAARLIVWCALHIPEFRCRCYQVNEDKSISEQQSFIWEALPQRFKNLGRRKGQTHTIQYTQANGFTGGKLIIPPLPGYKRGGEILFGNYQQYKNDPQVVEGWWAHLIWCDEETPQKMYERLLTRLGDARGRLIMTFTTIQGWSPLVAEILGKTRTLRRRKSDMLGGKEIPVAQESLSRNSTRIYYFWTQDNPFIPPEFIYDLMKGRPADEIKAVAHGIPSKSATTPFPKFDESVHVLPAAKMPWLLEVPEGRREPEFTRYHVIDPSGSKPWFMIWAAVDSRERIYVYREWPDESYGAWAEPGNTVEGKKGPAQKPNGFGIADYVEQFAYVEGQDEIFERVIDPRLGAATTQTKDGSVSIISELDDAGITTIQAPGLQIEHGVQLINDRLGYDQNADVSSLNSPKLFISDACVNLIYALKEWTGKGGKDEATKDPIDCLRYLLENGADFVSKTDSQPFRNKPSY
jgi:phage terminase large subunit-like protein